MTVHTDFLFSKANRWQSVKHDVQCATSRVQARDYPILFISTLRLCQRTGLWKQSGRIVKKILTIQKILKIQPFKNIVVFISSQALVLQKYSFFIFILLYNVLKFFFLKHFILKILSDLSEVGNRTFENYRYKSEQNLGLVFTSYLYFCSHIT